MCETRASQHFVIYIIKTIMFVCSHKEHNVPCSSPYLLPYLFYSCVVQFTMKYWTKVRHAFWKWAELKLNISYIFCKILIFPVFVAIANGFVAMDRKKQNVFWTDIPNVWSKTQSKEWLLWSKTISIDLFSPDYAAYGNRLWH